MYKNGHVPYFRITLILVILCLIAGIASICLDNLPFYFVINIVQILCSATALVLCIHAVSRNKGEILYKILTFAIACVFLNYIYSIAHYLVVGSNLDYFIILLPYLGAVSFMSVLNFSILEKLKPTHRFLPLLAILPALGLAYAFWMVGHTPIISILYTIVICFTAYTITSVLITKKGKAFIFLEICILVNAVLGIFWVSGMSQMIGSIMAEILQIIFIIAPLMYLPALTWGLKKCQ